MTPQQTNQARELLRQTTYTQQKAVWWGELILACVAILILLAVAFFVA